MHTKSVNERRNRIPLGSLALPLLALALSVACSSRSPSPSVPTLPKPTPPSTPAPAPGSPTSSTSSTSSKGETPTTSTVPGRPDAPVPDPTAKKGGSTGPEVASTENDKAAAEATGEAPAGGPRTTEEKKQALDGDLNASLSEFDRMLLREQEILAEERAAQAAAAGNGSSESGGGAGGSFGEGTATQTADASGDSGAGGATGDSPDTPPGEAGEAGAPVGGKEEAESTNGRIPPDVGDGRDDDIVARQLREAAMNEEDPVLREKLWDEYRAYKKGTTGGNN